MVLFHGANVRQARLEERSILDIMPTILSCLDCPVPTDVDGAVIEDAFVEDLRPVDTRAPIDATPSNAQQPTADGDLKGRLEELGYLE
jgi:arylsulfatase A-like enzyme